MGSNLQQLQLTYDQVQDRLILTLFTSDWSEFRFWLTRKVTKGLWGILLQLLKADQKTELQHQQESQKVEKKIQEESAQRQKMAEKYASTLTRKPLGDEPMLINKIMAKPNPQGQVFIHFEDTQGRSIEFGGDSKILLALCQLLEKITVQADWGLNFNSP